MRCTPGGGGASSARARTSTTGRRDGATPRSNRRARLHDRRLSLCADHDRRREPGRSRRAYTVLTGHICGEPVRPGDPPRNYVTPFSAEYSQLMYQLRGEDATGRPYRDVMPPRHAAARRRDRAGGALDRRGGAMRLILVAIVLATAAGRADAYPQFQLSLGADRCVKCHYSPAGGGSSMTTAATKPAARSAAGATAGSCTARGRHRRGCSSGSICAGPARSSTAIRNASCSASPMQTDVYLRAGGERISFSLTAGMRGGARDPQPPFVERLVSREHYFMYQRESGAYVRAGRFFPIYGFRSQDHTAYVRRYLGLHTLEEPYGLAAGTFGPRRRGPGCRAGARRPRAPRRFAAHETATLRARTLRACGQPGIRGASSTAVQRGETASSSS